MRDYATASDSNRINSSFAAATAPSREEIIRLHAQEFPNVPFEHWQRLSLKQLNDSCAQVPPMHSLRFHNNYWQVFHNRNVTYHLFNAYFDVRAYAMQRGAVVRVLAMANEVPAPSHPSYCQLWYDTLSVPVIVPVVEQRLIWFLEWGTYGDYYPYLLSCVPPLPLRQTPPRAVSLVARFCDTASNMLRVLYEHPAANETQHGFAVCVKGLDYLYDDMGPRLVEWLELQRLLGARKVITYKLVLHPNLARVLQHYVAEGFVELLPLSLGSEMADLPHYLHDYLHSDIANKRLNELVPYNDCFYRNMYKYAYIAVVDVDEVIMPLGNSISWQQLIETALRRRTEDCPRGYASVCVRNAIFPINTMNYTETTTAQSHMFLLQHVHRLNRTGEVNDAVKCFHNTSEVLTLHNHYHIARLEGCHSFHFEPVEAQLQHYRLLEETAAQAALTRDESIYRYKDALVRNVEAVLRQLGYLD
ncbi:uncharacterized protein LOC118748296 [Rhagoletis pomonella]|uniref:uncharacterized protein LOC118748296 n=1 Tax=Rhagoletis pomonella TaxID=28610 RepID=UPI001783D52F|nr:uncharacterized protein LOC118748296 [Rhagoletis pomonella]